MKTREGTMVSTVASALIRLIEFIVKLLYRSDDKRKQQEIDAAKEELRKALSEGRVTDAAYWNKKVNQLEAARALNVLAKAKGLVILILLSAAASGCLTSKPEQPPMPIVIGERINKVKPGDRLVVPALAPPAKQWYLVDDVGLYQWLDINP
jgi:hypothetical protein